MLWLIILLIAIGLAVPHWLGIAPPKIARERRFIARMTIVGLTAGLLFNTALTFAWRHLDFDLSPFLVIMNGGAVGGLIGLVGAMVMRVKERIAPSTVRETELKP